MSQEPGYGLLYKKPAANVVRYREINLGDMATQDGSSVEITGGTVIGATLAGAVQTITEAGAISLNANHVKITGPATSTYAVTLAAPTRGGQVMVIEMTSTTSTNAVTLAMTTVIGGTQATTATFNAAAETLVLVSNSAKWVVIKEQGVTLS